MPIGVTNFRASRARMLEDAVERSGIGLINELRTRRTGKSLADAMITIGLCLQNPGIKIKLHDHIGNNRRTIQMVQVSYIETLLRDLGLEGFKLNLRELTLTFELYE